VNNIAQFDFILSDETQNCTLSVDYKLMTVDQFTGISTITDQGSVFSSCVDVHSSLTSGLYLLLINRNDVSTDQLHLSYTFVETL
jgi:hypothetical protein